MWTYYIDAMLKLNADLSSQASMKRFALQKAFEGATESDHMSEDYYIRYIEILYTENPKDGNIERVFQKSTAAHETSLKLWNLCLRYYMEGNDFKKIQNIFNTAKTLLGANGAELWQLYFLNLKSYQSTEIKREFDQIFIEELSCQSHPSFNTLKTQVLQLLAATVNIEEVRTIYEKFVINQPACYEVHETMANIEASQVRKLFRKFD